MSSSEIKEGDEFVTLELTMTEARVLRSLLGDAVLGIGLVRNVTTGIWRALRTIEPEGSHEICFFQRCVHVKEDDELNEWQRKVLTAQEDT